MCHPTVHGPGKKPQCPVLHRRGGHEIYDVVCVCLSGLFSLRQPSFPRGHHDLPKLHRFEWRRERSRVDARERAQRAQRIETMGHTCWAAMACLETGARELGRRQALRCAYSVHRCIRGRKLAVNVSTNVRLRVWQADQSAEQFVSNVIRDTRPAVL